MFREDREGWENRECREANGFFHSSLFTLHFPFPEQQAAKHGAPEHGEDGKQHGLNAETAERTDHTRVCPDLDAEQEEQKPDEKSYGTRNY